MAQIVVRDLEEDVKQRLKRRALRHGRSMEDEIRHILRDATRQSATASVGLGTRIAEIFKEADFVVEIPELRGALAKPAEFDR